MHGRRFPRGLLALALWLGTATAATPDELRIEPVSLTLQPGQSAATLWLGNGGAAPLHAQVRVFAWSQADGGEVLSPTRELAVSPPLVQVPAQGRQLVRVVRIAGDDAPPAEAAYRLIVDQLPGGDPAAHLLRYSIPVFAAPARPPAGPRLSARIEEDVTGRRLLRLENSGDRHARVADLAFVGTGGQVHVVAPNLAGYVLAGSYKHWPLPADAGRPPYGRFQAEVDGAPAVLVPAPELLGGP